VARTAAPRPPTAAPPLVATATPAAAASPTAPAASAAPPAASAKPAPPVAAATPTATPTATTLAASPTAAPPISAAAAADDEAAAEAKRLAKIRRAVLRAKKGTLKFLVDADGTSDLASMHDHSERRYFIAHRGFSNLMEEMTGEGLVDYDHATGVATLLDPGRSWLEAN
jgi:hypothetical protein